MKQVSALFVSVFLLPFLTACDRQESIPLGPDTTPPLPPVNLIVFDARDGSVLLLWRSNREGDLAGYRIYRMVEMQPDSFRIVGEANETAFVDEGLDYDTTYLYAVTAFDRSGNESDRSNDVSAQPINVFPPRQPRDTRVQAHNREDGVFISLQWDANTEGDLKGYYVYRSLDPDVRIEARFLLDSTFSTAYRDTMGVEVGRPLYYRITALDKGQLESTPTPVQWDRPLVQPILASPADGSLAPAFPTFRWRPVPDASNYAVFVSTSRFSGEIWSSTLGDTTVVYGGPFLTAGNTYYWKVGTITNTPWDPNSLSDVWSFRRE